jgi:hypothetical protein
MIRNNFKYRNYAALAKSDTWSKHLKPDLEKIKDELSASDTEPQSGFEAIKRDVKRSQTNSVINRIIRLIEKAEDKIGRRN